LARAKRTNRTDARRRNRAQQATELDGFEDDDELVEPADTSSPAPARRRAASPAARSSSGSPSAGPRPARPSFIGSARLAYRPPNVREDLAFLPRLLLHWSVLVSAALAVGGTALLVVVGTSSPTASTVGYLASMLVSLFVGPPPFGAALLLGFMLPRATYLVGLVFGVLASACFTAVVLAQPTDTTAGVSVPAILAQVWILGPLGTMFFAAGIAWYKRFLDLLNPNRGQRGKAAAKPVQGRGNAPRNRLSGSSR
jgi:hypothetical protein